jgi:hypothetical protein
MRSVCEMTIVELAEECLKNSLLRHSDKVYDVAQSRFEYALLMFENEETTQCKTIPCTTWYTKFLSTISRLLETFRSA